MQQMSAMMSMAAVGMSNNGISSDMGAGVLPMQTTVPAAGVAEPSGFAPHLSGAPVPPVLPAVDPSMAQAYAQMFAYLQQAQAYTDAGAGSAPLFPAAPAMPTYNSNPLPPTPVISVSVDGMKFQYQLTEDDLQKVFSRYGGVRQIYVEGGTMAQIAFDDYNGAQAAMNDLNGKVLNGLEGTLRINWATSGPLVMQPAAAPAAPYSMVPPPFPGGWGFPGTTAWPTTPASGLGMLGSGLGDVSNFPMSPMPAANQPMSPCTPEPHNLAANLITPDGKAPAHVKGVRKYTCRFLIGIENDKDFQVVRRVIGAKGANMKRIVKQSEAKLRLRGVGSGYFEGAGQKESNEPLQLCVSCTSPDGYSTAVSLVEELLEGVYVEYRAFCEENGRPKPDLHATPQLVSSGRERGGALTIDQLFSPDSPSLALEMGDADDDDDLPGILARREGGRKRGRRSRGKKSDAGKMDKGEPPRNAPDAEEIHGMIDARNEARRQCNFAEADRLRQSLHERGVALMDEPGGRGKASEVTTWRYWRE